MEEKKQSVITDDMRMLIAGIMPNTKYFDSRFDLLQVQIDGLQVQINGIQVQITGLKDSQNETKERIDRLEQSVDKRFEQVDKRFEQVDKRFEQVDKRFEQVISSIDRMGDKLDKKMGILADKLEHRDEKQRGFTLRMFTIAISTSVLGVFGVFLRIAGLI